MNTLIGYAGSDKRAPVVPEAPRKNRCLQPEFVGRGNRYHNLTRIMVPLEADTFSAIRARAVAEKTSFAQQVRLLVERGLTAES